MKNFYTKDLIRDEFKNSVGLYTYGNPIISGSGGQNLSIGKFCSIAGDVHILLGAGHSYERFSSYPFDNIKDESGVIQWPSAPPGQGIPKIGVFIGNDVWIGCRVTILPGVHIGDGAVIGAGSVVAKDIPPYAIVYGNPIMWSKKRFTDFQIEKLLQMQWWNWPIEKIKEALPLLDNVDELIAKYAI